jgi:hypothetical protein
MKALSKRIAALEQATTPWERAHMILWHDDKGQSEDAAIDAYGRDRISPNDLKIMVRFVSPKSDAKHIERGATREAA